jgi:hypothetical protein
MVSSKYNNYPGSVQAAIIGIGVSLIAYVVVSIATNNEKATVMHFIFRFINSCLNFYFAYKNLFLFRKKIIEIEVKKLI